MDEANMEADGGQQERQAKNEKLWKAYPPETYRNTIAELVHFSSKTVNSNAALAGVRLASDDALDAPYVSARTLMARGVSLSLDYGKGGAAVAGYVMFAHVKKRVAIWRNPWIYYETSGYQIVQMLMAIASGGLFGVGLGLGAPRVIPVYFTDCIFAVICEQFGVIFGALVLAMYVILILRGASIASAARHSFHALLAMGATVMLGVQTFVIIGGVLKLIPLTGVTMPFVSYGGTSLVSCMGLIGLIQGVASVNQDDLAYDYEISHSLREAALLPEADGEE